MSVESQQIIQIKGTREGLLASIPEGDWSELLDILLQQVDEKAGFFQGAKITLDVGARVLRAAELGNLRNLLAEHNVSLWAVLSSSASTKDNAQTLGLATQLLPPRPERQMHSLDTTLSGESAVLVHRTLRSGFKITNPGHVVVIGDVNPGAEIIAGGSVVVWGRLKGVVHAGAEGDDSAVICALDLSATQIRIAGHITTTPQRRGKAHPEMVRIVNDQVVAEPWNL